MTTTTVTHTLTLPWSRPPSTSNDQRRRGHWSQQAAAKREVTDGVAWLARIQHLPRMRRVAVMVTWWPPDRRRRDTDGLAPFVKACLDGIVQAGVLEDDHAGIVPSVTLRVGPTDKPGRLELELAELDDEAAVAA